MKTHDFILVNADTDSISFSKKDGSKFSDAEQDYLLDELNSIFPKKIRFESEGVFSKVIVLAAKNYILYDGKKTKIKGSALKDSKKEIAIREFTSKIIESLLHDRNDFNEIYNEYIKEIYNIKEIKRWSSKKTITEKVLTSERTNETKIFDAIAGTDYKSGDKCYMFFKTDCSLCLAENFTGDYNPSKLLEKLYKSTKVFAPVLNVADLFINYALKRNRDNLNNIINPDKKAC